MTLIGGDRRSAFRVATDAACSLLVENGDVDHPHHAEILDISLTGARLHCELDLPIGQKLIVCLDDPSETRRPARVVRQGRGPMERLIYGVVMIEPWSLEAFYSLAFPDELLSAEAVRQAAESSGVDWEPDAGYRIIRRLGEGGAGEVFEAIAPGGISKAIKRIPLDPNNPLSIREVLGFRLVRAIRHPYLLGIDRLTIEHGHLVVVLELADRTVREEFNSCVTGKMQGIPRDRLLALMREAAEVIDFLNLKYHVLHLDVKPENLFLVSGHLKLGDFGLIRELKPAAHSDDHHAVSPWYAAPELLEKQTSLTCDQYSLAVVYMEMLTGKRPFSGANLRQILFQHLTMKPNVTHLPPADQDVIARALSPNPKHRFRSCGEMVHCLAKGVTIFIPARVEPPPSPSAAGQQTRSITDTKAARAPKEIVNSIGMKLMYIPGGEFVMGSPDGEPEASAGEKPRRRVALRSAYYLGSTPVTQEQYHRVIGESPSGFAATGRYAEFVVGVDTNLLPVEHVSWFMACEFCNRLSEMEKLSPCYAIDGEKIEETPGEGYRLPTEAEWEFACRAGGDGRWCFGDDAKRLDDYAWYRRDRATRTYPVAQKTPNAFGLFDMHGNVHEWCWDWYSEEYYARGPLRHPRGPAAGIRRVLRGGSFYDAAARTRSAARHQGRPWDKGGNVGFRVVRSLIVG